MTEDSDDELMRNDWVAAESHACKTGDPSLVIEMLRKLHRYEDIPDLNFIADLLQGKFNKARMRPRENKIKAGLRQRLCAEAVAYICKTKGVTIEVACELASALFKESYPSSHHLSDSSIKKHYYTLSKSIKLVKQAGSLRRSVFVKSFIRADKSSINLT